MTTEQPSFVILLAEDEPADAHLVTAALSENRIPAILHHVVDGREALEFLRRQGVLSPNRRNLSKLPSEQLLSIVTKHSVRPEMPVERLAGNA